MCRGEEVDDCLLELLGTLGLNLIPLGVWYEYKAPKEQPQILRHAVQHI